MIYYRDKGIPKMHRARYWNSEDNRHLVNIYKLSRQWSSKCFKWHQSNTYNMFSHTFFSFITLFTSYRILWRGCYVANSVYSAWRSSGSMAAGVVVIPVSPYILSPVFLWLVWHPSWSGYFTACQSRSRVAGLLAVCKATVPKIILNFVNLWIIHMWE